MRAYRLKAQFLDSGDGQLYVARWLPHEVSGNSILIIPPFAEELNQSRVLLASLARQLAAHGCPVTLLDLYGTGDSDGDFGQTSWERWITDILTTCAWLAENDAAPATLVGVRLGALLALDAASRQQAGQLFLLQPEATGSNALRTLLRARTTAGWMGGSAAAETVESLGQRLIAGEAIEAAGYEISPALAGALRAATLETRQPPPGLSTGWLDIVPPQASAAQARSQQIASAWQQAGVPLNYQRQERSGGWNPADASLAAVIWPVLAQWHAGGQEGGPS